MDRKQKQKVEGEKLISRGKMTFAYITGKEQRLPRFNHCQNWR